jgi:peptidoglycan lytic transglycosylase G
MKKLGILLAVLVLAGGGFFFWFRQPYQGFQNEVFVSLDRGTNTRDIADALEKNGVVRYAWEFLLVRALNSNAKLQAGEYRFAAPASVFDVFRRIERGDVYHFDFTVPEGSNMFDIGRLLEEQGIMPAADFLKAASDPSLIADLAPRAKSLEGYLFPSTFRMTHTMTAMDLVRIMTQEFRKRWKQLAPGAMDVNSAVTLASLIEKETGAPQERPLVGSVFANRLSQGMKLESDPTTIYAALLEHRYSGVIHRSDLDNLSPYNTYRHEGLPPGPIANPGAESLEAALHPSDTKFLYFVAKPEGGGHQFSTTLAQHTRAVREYRTHAGIAAKPAH